MAMFTPYPARVEFEADRHIDRWRPLVQWLLAVPHLLIARALSALRSVLTLISFFTVLFTEQIPRPLFDMIAMTYRYEWRAMSYALFLHEDYPPFDFQPGVRSTLRCALRPLPTIGSPSCSVRAPPAHTFGKSMTPIGRSCETK